MEKWVGMYHIFHLCLLLPPVGACAPVWQALAPVLAPTKPASCLPGPRPGPRHQALAQARCPGALHCHYDHPHNHLWQLMTPGASTCPGSLHCGMAANGTFLQLMATYGTMYLHMPGCIALCHYYQEEENHDCKMFGN